MSCTVAVTTVTVHVMYGSSHIRDDESLPAGARSLKSHARSMSLHMVLVVLHDRLVYLLGFKVCIIVCIKSASLIHIVQDSRRLKQLENWRMSAVCLDRCKPSSITIIGTINDMDAMLLQALQACVGHHSSTQGQHAMLKVVVLLPNIN